MISFAPTPLKLLFKYFTNLSIIDCIDFNCFSSCGVKRAPLGPTSKSTFSLAIVSNLVI